MSKQLYEMGINLNLSVASTFYDMRHEHTKRCIHCATSQGEMDRADVSNDDVIDLS